MTVIKFDSFHETRELESKEKFRVNQLKSIFEEIVTLQTNGIVPYLKNIQNKTWFILSVILTVVIYVTYNLNITNKFIVSMCFGLVVIYIYYEHVRFDNTDEMSTIEYQWMNIKPFGEHLHLDANLIEFLYTLREWWTYNELEYVRLVNTVNKFLKLKQDLMNPRFSCKGHIQTFKDFMDKIMNAAHNMIFAIPPDNAFFEQHKNALRVLQTYLERHFTELKNKCTEMDFTFDNYVNPVDSEKNAYDSY